MRQSLHPTERHVNTNLSQVHENECVHVSPHRLCGDDVFLLAAVEPANSFDGHVVGLGGSTREEDLFRVSANQTGNLLQRREG